MRVTFGNFDSSRSYSIAAIQQLRALLDSDTNKEAQAALQPKKISLGIAEIKDGFEPAKREIMNIVMWCDLFKHLFRK